jgi:hypothetical protein
MNDDAQIRPYRIAISDEDLADLRQRLDRVRWAPEPVGGDTGYGVPVSRVRTLVEQRPPPFPLALHSSPAT